MDVVAPFLSNTETSELMQPSERAFHDPAIDAQAAAVLCASFGEHRVRCRAGEASGDAVRNHRHGRPGHGPAYVEAGLATIGI